MAKRKTSRKFFSLKLDRKTKKKLIIALGVVLAFSIFLFFLSRFQPHRRRFFQKPKGKIARSSGARVSAPPRLKPRVWPVPYRQLPPRVFGPGPKIAFVIDDIGNRAEHSTLLRALGDQVTYSILPFVRHSRYFDELSRQTGADVILHLPLESLKGTIPGPGLITTQMSDQAVLELLNRDLASVPHAIGANNHMGSKGTSDPHLMRLILSELKKRNLFFLDSKTSSRSVAAGMSGELGMPVLKRDIFLDNEAQQDAIRNEIREASGIAQKRGYAVAIGHYRYSTLEVLLEEIPRLRREGYQVVGLEDLLRERR